MLEDKIDQLEQYTRQENIIITGLKTSHKSCSCRVTSNDANCDGENAPHEELETLENQVIGYLNTNLDVNIKACDVSACHTLNGDKKGTFDMPKIIVRFVNRKRKIELLKNSRKLKSTRVYIHEHLTHRNSQIAYAARILKKQGKIYSTWTKDCIVFIKRNHNPDVAKVHCIKNETDFDMLHLRVTSRLSS